MALDSGDFVSNSNSSQVAFPLGSARERIARDPHVFEFFQAVRLICQETGSRIGGDLSPAAEPVRFRTLSSLSFPPSQITDFELRRHDETGTAATAADLAADLEVSFFGLTGSQGVLPDHYTQLVIDRVRHQDLALRDFLDLFNHRTVSLFYAAWERARLPVRFERAAQQPSPSDHDLFTSALFCLIGMGTGGLQHRYDLPDAVFVHYGGHFGHDLPQAVCLEQMLNETFQLSATVVPFIGQWLHLDDHDQTRLPAQTSRVDLRNQLGSNAIVGDRVWNVEHRFRIRIGPLAYDEFVRLMPCGDDFGRVGQFVRRYVGLEYDVELQLVLRSDQVPGTRLGQPGSAAARLGWNTWLQSAPRTTDAEEAIFDAEGAPTN